MENNILDTENLSSTNMKRIIRGAGCSLSGKTYELKIYNIVNKCYIHDESKLHLFNTQQPSELGGCGSKSDIVCMFGEKQIPIEIKKLKAPDWMQCSLHFSEENRKWKGSSACKIPTASKLIFEDILFGGESGNTILFGGKIPPFMQREITHEEWINIKKNTDDFNDFYVDCPSTTISRLYRETGCKYIQVSEKGLFHLGDDACQFGVPEFICEQQLRIRTKIHTRKNTRGFCKLSVIVACQPKHPNAIQPSPFSLDSIEKLPTSLVHRPEESTK